MPNHDRNGNELKVGDVVYVPAVVVKIDMIPEFYNIECETVEPMFPGEHKTPLLLNAKQVEKPIVLGPELGMRVEDLIQRAQALTKPQAATLWPPLLTMEVDVGEKVTLNSSIISTVKEERHEIG